MYVCMYACMYACMYVCMYACVCVLGWLQVVISNVSPSYIKSFGDNEGGFEFTTNNNTRKKLGNEDTTMHVWAEVQIIR